MLSIACLVRPVAAATLVFLPFPAATTPSRPVAGLTFTAKTSVELSPGMQQMRQPLVLSGKGFALPGGTRIELDKVDNADGILAPGDLLIVSRGAKALAVRPSLKTYAELTAPLQDQLAPMSNEAGESLHAGAVPAKFEHVGAGGQIEGRDTEQYRLRTMYSADMPGHSVTVTITIDVWGAKLPFPVANPLLAFGTASGAPIHEFRQKIAAAFASLGSVTPVKTVITTSLAVADMSHEIVQTTTLTGITPADVDPAAVSLPAGYTASAR